MPLRVSGPAKQRARARSAALRTTSTDVELLGAGADWIADDLSALALDKPGRATDLAFRLTAKK
jgi:hypothetical protein